MRGRLRTNVCSASVGRAQDLPFDMMPASARLDDLDMDYVRTHYLPHAVARDVLQRNERSLDQQQRSLRMVQSDSPTWGAILALGQDPQAFVPGAYVQFLRVDGARITDPIRHQKHLIGRLDDVVRQLDELFDLNISVRTRVAGALREVRRPDYPVDALRQFSQNAIMHRSYEGTHTPVRVRWFGDRVEIISPGGLYGRITPENFGAGETDYRNPLIAEVMHNLGFAQRFGLGLPLAREALERNGNAEPEFRFGNASVAVTMRAT